MTFLIVGLCVTVLFSFFAGYRVLHLQSKLNDKEQELNDGWKILVKPGSVSHLNEALGIDDKRAGELEDIGRTEMVRMLRDKSGKGSSLARLWNMEGLTESERLFLIFSFSWDLYRLFVTGYDHLSNKFFYLELMTRDRNIPLSQDLVEVVSGFIGKEAIILRKLGLDYDFSKFGLKESKGKRTKLESFGKEELKTPMGTVDLTGLSKEEKKKKIMEAISEAVDNMPDTEADKSDDNTEETTVPDIGGDDESMLSKL